MQGCTPLHVAMSQDMEIVGSIDCNTEYDYVEEWHEELRHQEFDMRRGEAQVGYCGI